MGQYKLLAALALLSAFRLAAHHDFVPVNVSPRLEAVQSLGILSIRKVSLLTTGGRKITSYIAPNPPSHNSLWPSCIAGGSPWSFYAFPCVQGVQPSHGVSPFPAEPPQMELETRMCSRNHPSNHQLLLAQQGGLYPA